MKTLKIIIISIVIISIFALAFYREDTVNIEGTWEPEKIVLDNKILFPTKIDSLLRGIRSKHVVISEWNDSLYIVDGKERITSSFQIQKNKSGNHLIHLSSKEKSLNGTFNLKVDTLYTDSDSYEIKVNIQSKTSIIMFKKSLQIKPWKPQYPRRGAV
ncbi:hypothetical protein B0I03_105181 [Flavobacterium aquaticum]|uniref:Uncharacterized protein n=1 Tax=Flavobacterium aquaticum TaxID=1236486 RepID=A0A327YLA8_9FLAO|nr:hypothetical protein [Flavobacterium aquaticum]RAK21748.1 hypothetical protein B0I03_105181 [Flavobacterium aquaticum]